MSKSARRAPSAMARAVSAAGRVSICSSSKRHVVGHGDGEAAQAAGLGGADSDACTFADVVNAEVGELAEADDEKTFGLEVVWGVEQNGLAQCGLEFSGGEPGAGGGGEGVGGGEQRRGGLGQRHR